MFRVVSMVNAQIHGFTESTPRKGTQKNFDFLMRFRICTIMSIYIIFQGVFSMTNIKVHTYISQLLRVMMFYHFGTVIAVFKIIIYKYSLKQNQEKIGCKKYKLKLRKRRKCIGVAQ